MPRSVQLRRLFVALLLSCAVLVGATACGDSGGTGASSSASASPTTSAEAQKFAKTRFVANAGPAAGATYQWIVKPYRAGRFKKGADGRTFTVVKAGLAGVFAYNRLKAAADNAKGAARARRAKATSAPSRASSRASRTRGRVRAPRSRTRSPQPRSWADNQVRSGPARIRVRG